MGHYSQRLLSYIRTADQVVTQTKEQKMRDYGITTAQHAALAVLSDHDGVTSAELARLCGVTPQTMNSTVGRLETRGLVTRKPHATHRTLIEISLTEQGSELFRRADAGAEELDAVLSSGLTAGERATLVDLLTRVTGQARAVSERRGPGSGQPAGG
jgi:DNA-binding MarR family transcriptional regulator